MISEGQLIAGRYRLVTLLGQGGMGVVWRARDERLDRTVAVKLLLAAGPAGEATDEAMRRASREARVAARLRHPNAVMMHDVVEHDGKPCLVMEFVEARSLAQLLAERGTLEPLETARIGAQLAAALAAAHAAGIVHRDVKPGNVLTTPEGTTKLADFGISRAVGEGTVTTDGLVAGTPAYLSPEVASGEEARAASDVYSLGATLYTATEGAPPSGDSDNPLALLARIARGSINRPVRSGPLTDVLTGMLRADPAERPVMADVARALDAIADGRSASLPPPPRRGPTLLLPRRDRRPSRRSVLLGALAVGLAAGVTVGVVIAQDDGDTPAAPANSAAPTSSASPPGPGCDARYRVTNTWPGGFQGEVVVRARGGELTGWQVTWELPDGEEIREAWNGMLSRTGASVTVTDAGWNAVLRTGETAQIGFNGERTDDEAPATPEVTCEPR